MGDKYLVQTRSQMKSSRVKLPEVHTIEQDLDQYIKPGRQRLVSPSTDLRPHISNSGIGWGRAGIRRKVKIVPPLQTPAPEAT